MAIKIFAYGFLFNKKAYLRDLWNILDFLVVLTSLLPFVIQLGFSMNALRALRVLRPLKTITKIKSLKMIVSTLFSSFTLVMNSFYLLFFVIMIFAIAGQQLFSGCLKNRCIELSTGIVSDILCVS
jgi:energy-coupling factor transporter transmembrane protein EcfT